MHDIQVGNTKDIQSLPVQELRSPVIITQGRGVTMLGTIQFHHQFGFVAIKINNIYTDGILPFELHRICFQEIIPQMPFLFRHIFTQFLGVFPCFLNLLHIRLLSAANDKQTMLRVSHVIFLFGCR